MDSTKVNVESARRRQYSFVVRARTPMKAEFFMEKRFGFA